MYDCTDQPSYQDSSGFPLALARSHAVISKVHLTQIILMTPWNWFSHGTTQHTTSCFCQCYGLLQVTSTCLKLRKPSYSLENASTVKSLGVKKR